MKKALFTFFTGGVTYKKGEVYANEIVADLDPTNFEDTDETVAEVDTVEVVDSEKEEVKSEVDTENVDDNKGGDVEVTE